MCVFSLATHAGEKPGQLDSCVLLLGGRTGGVPQGLRQAVPRIGDAAGHALSLNASALPRTHRHRFTWRPTEHSNIHRRHSLVLLCHAGTRDGCADGGHLMRRRSRWASGRCAGGTRRTSWRSSASGPSTWWTPSLSAWQVTERLGLASFRGIRDAHETYNLSISALALGLDQTGSFVVQQGWGLICLGGPALHCMVPAPQ